MPPAARDHGRMAGRIATAVGSHAEETRQGEMVTADAGFVLRRGPDCVRAPDVAFVSAGHLPAEEGPGTFFEVAPDLAVEVVSPSETTQDTEAKVRDYLAAGTRLVWLIYPGLRAARVWRQDGTTEAIDESGVLHGEDVLLGFELPLSRVLP